MMYAQRSRHGIWKYRRSIPQALRQVAAAREINVSLRTRDDQAAQLAYVKAHGETEVYLRNLSRLAAGPRTATGDKEIAELGRTYLRQIKMPYLPLVDLKAQAASAKGFSEYEQRLKFVQDDLGIEIDDPETRDAEINASIKARAVLGTLPAESFDMVAALRVYLSDKSPSLATMSPKKAKRFRLGSERVVRAFGQAIEGDKSLSSITRGDARIFRDHLLKQPLAVVTVNKYVRMAATIWTAGARDAAVGTTNPFSGHAISDEISAIERRDILTKETAPHRCCLQGELHISLFQVPDVLPNPCS